jgi:hypothetical protein
MQSLKFLTIRGRHNLLTYFTFPSLTSLEIFAKGVSTPRLSGHDIPNRLEILRTHNVTINLEDIGRINPLRNIRVFEAVESTIICETHGKFSLPKVQNLHIEDMRTNSTKEPYGYPDISLILNAHQSMESVHSLSIVGMHITTAAIDTLQMLKGLTKVTIERCRFQGDTFHLFRHMLMPYRRSTAFPSLQSLRLNDLHVYHYKGVEYTKMDGSRLFVDIK